MRAWKSTDVGQQFDSRRRDYYKQLSNGCDDYHPCPINFECQSKAPHLYSKCDKCEVPHAKHNHKVRSYMIRRENFAIKVSDEAGAQLLELSRRAEEKIRG